MNEKTGRKPTRKHGYAAVRANVVADQSGDPYQGYAQFQNLRTWMESNHRVHGKRIAHYAEAVAVLDLAMQVAYEFDTVGMPSRATLEALLKRME